MRYVSYRFVSRKEMFSVTKAIHWLTFCVLLSSSRVTYIAMQQKTFIMKIIFPCHAPFILTIYTTTRHE